MKQLDLTRAARAADFGPDEDDLNRGRAAAACLFRTIRAHMKDGTLDIGTQELLEEACKTVADDWGITDLPADQLGGPLSALSNALVDIYRDIHAQVTEAQHGAQS